MPRATFRDESPLGERLADFDLPDLPERLTVRELVRLRVREEVARRHGLDPHSPYRGLVTPTRTERELNGSLPGSGRSSSARGTIDGERQADLAEQAFEHQRFVIIVGDRQVESLDEDVDLTTEPEIVFIKLVPLVGG